MKGTVLLIKEDHSVTTLENIDYDIYEKLNNHRASNTIRCTINNKEVKFTSISKVIWFEDMVDWDYGY